MTILFKIVEDSSFVDTSNMDSVNETNFTYIVLTFDNAYF